MGSAAVVGAAAVAAVLSVPAGSTAANAAPGSGCMQSGVPDFNGDGLRDVAIADPEATVDGAAGAGVVRVVFGGGKGVAEVSQAFLNDSASPEAGDRFGYSIAVYDANGDGCSDLAVGTPYEDVAKDGVPQADAGAVYIVHGSPSGIDAGAVVDSYTQRGLDSSTATEAGDLFGFSLAAGETAGNEPFLVIGVPGEAIGNLDDAGCIHYVQGATRATANQDDPGIGGAAEANDRMGYSVSATPHFFAVGTPGEAIGDQGSAGAGTLFTHQIQDGVANAFDSLGEDQPYMVSGTSEYGDRFGTALAMLPYRPAEGATETHALLAVGVPNEDVGSVRDAGAVTMLHIEPSGNVTELGLVDRFSLDVAGEPVVGDLFGQQVALANTAPGAVGTAETIELAVGVPNQEVGAAENAGAVHLLPGLGSPGAGDRIMTRGDGLLPGVAGAREFTGTSLHATSTDLYLGIPYSKGADAPKGVVYGLPWSAVSAGAGTVRTFQPGAGGLPDEGGAFGLVIR